MSQNTILFGTYFYHSTIRKITAVFGDMFNDLVVARYTEDGTTELERLTVPLVYGSKEHWVMRLMQDPTLTRSVQVQLPLISYQLRGFEYDSSRKQQSLIKRYNVNTAISTADTVNMQFIEVPWNFYYDLAIYVKTYADGFQILEQILAIFKPDYTVRINFDNAMGISKDVPMILENSSLQISDNGTEEDMRTIVISLSFKAKGYIFGPETPTGVITKANVNFYNTLQTNGITVLQLRTGGFGTYKVGDMVYQGLSLQQPSALANVVSWDTTNKKLYIMASSGLFTTNANVVCANTGAAWNVNSFYNSNGLPAAITIVTPKPLGANANTVTGFTLQIKEFPNTP